MVKIAACLVALVTLLTTPSEAAETQVSRLELLQKVLVNMEQLGKAGGVDFSTKEFIGAMFEEAWRFKPSKEEPENASALGQAPVKESLKANGSVLKCYFGRRQPTAGGTVILFLDSSDGSLLHVYHGR